MPSTKLSAMMIIFISASPLASLIRIFMLLYNYFFTSTTTITDYDMDGHQNPLLYSSSAAARSTLSGVLLDYFTNNGNVTIDDIMQSILNHQPFHPYYPTKNTIHPFHPILTFVAKDKLNQDIQMVIPWIFAFTTLIIIPLIMIVCNALWRRNEMESNFRKKRIDVYRRCLVDFQKEVDDCDIMTYNDQNNNNDDYDNTSNKNNNMLDKNDVQKEQMQEDNTFIVIPKPGISIHQNNNYPDTHKQYREVPATCAICLSCYTPGETIVWSSYAECSHAFHLSCIDTWIKKRYATSCPCCRRNFIDSEIYAKMKYSRVN